MMKNIFIILFLLKIIFTIKPIIFYHGLLGHHSDFFLMRDLIRKEHPNAKMYFINEHQYLSSLFTPLYIQTSTLISDSKILC